MKRILLSTTENKGVVPRQHLVKPHKGDTMKKIIIAAIGFSMVLLADLGRNAAGVVTDSTTGLQWQDDYSDNGGNIKSATWQDAIDYCEALTLDGGRWRLPNIRELNSIADLSRVNPAIDPVFQHTATGYYWSSSTDEGLHDDAWYVNFYNGYRYAYLKVHSDYVRCVRPGE